MPRKYADRFRTTLATAITTTGQTTFDVASVSGFPVLNTGDFAIISVTRPDGSANERMRVNAAPSGVTVTVVRGAEDSTPATFDVGAIVDVRVTATAMANWETARDFALFGSPIIWNGAGGVDAGFYNAGGAAPSGDGTATARAVATTNLFTSQRRIARVSTSTAGTNAGWNGTAVFTRGSGTRAGGFYLIAEWGISDAAPVADARNFIGLSQNSIGNVNPSTLLNIVGVGSDNGETTLSVMHNDGSGTATKVSLGASFPCDTQNTDWYRSEFVAEPNASTIRYRITRRNTGDIAEGVLSTDLPVNTALMAMYFRRNNGATAAAVGIDLGYARLYPHFVF